MTRDCCVLPWTAGYVSIPSGLGHRTEYQINNLTGDQRRRDSCLWPHDCKSEGRRKWSNWKWAASTGQISPEERWWKTWTRDKISWDLPLRWPNEGTLAASISVFFPVSCESLVWPCPSTGFATPANFHDTISCFCWEKI